MRPTTLASPLKAFEERVRQEDRVFATRRQAAERRRRASEVPEIARYRRHPGHGHAVFRRDPFHADVEGDGAFEGGRAVVERNEIGRGDNFDRFDGRHAIVIRHDPDQPIAVSVRQRPQ
ncbi:MAG: hypothetical protein DMF96_24795 [Acidobacteria bacterium]|nr:MAG: hypothetical protein DMF96_24795 [Acidobacteriota bacterium]